MGDWLLYACRLEVSEEDLDRKKSFRPDATYLHDLINEKWPSPMSFYYGQVHRTDARIWGDILEFIAILEERERRGNV